MAMENLFINSEFIKPVRSWTILFLVIVQVTISYCSTTSPAPVPCTTPIVPNSNYLPNQVSFNNGETVTFTCVTGYELTSGSLDLTCGVGGSWAETPPTCIIKTCGAVDIANADRTPLQAFYNYNTIVTYTCNEGYSLASGDLVRSCTASKTWSGTEPVCQIITCASSDAAFATKLPATSTVTYNTTVTYTCTTGYELTSGNSPRTCQASGALSGTLPVCSIITCASSDAAFATKSPATTTVTYNTIVTYACITGYEITSGNPSRICQANGALSGTIPVCLIVSCASSDAAFAIKSPATSTVTYNTVVTYTCITGYEITSENSSRTCEVSGALSGTLPVCSIITCASSDAAFAAKLPATSTVTYNTTVTYACTTGYELTSGNSSRSCEASGALSGTLPICSIITCASSDAAFATKLPATSTVTYNTTITYTCITGYELTSGNSSRTCVSSGALSGTLPVCSIITCASSDAAFATKSPATSTVTFNTTVTYTCITGYELTSGNSSRTCQASGALSGTLPVCLIITCASSDAAFATKSPATSTVTYNTIVTYTCITGYEITIGNLSRTCQASGALSGTLPVCLIITCASSDAAFATKSPATSTVTYNTTVTYTCITGYELNSDNSSRTCQASGALSGTLPVCLIITCASSDAAFATKLPATSTVTYNTIVTYTCITGYELTIGNSSRTCQASGALSGTLPVCSIKTCLSNDSTFATKSPASSLVDYNTTVTYACDEGYEVTSGDVIRDCQASGVLSGTLPVCSIINCSNTDVVALATKSPSSPTVNFNIIVSYACDLGYEISSGHASRTCQANGNLTGTAPVCTLITCTSPDVTFGTKSPATSSVDFNISVTYACVTGYEVTNGNAIRTCDTSSDLSGTLPVCSIKTCTAPAVAYADKSPTSPSIDYNTVLTYACITGYNHTGGDLTRTCQHNSTLSGDAPTCTIVTCVEPANITLATKLPIQSSYDYNTQVVYTCDTGYKLDTGDLTRTCTANGIWSGTEPACTIVTCAAPAVVNHASLTPIADPYTYDTTLNYTCAIGYELTSGTLERTCQANGVISGTAPVCTIKTCTRELVTNGTPDPNQSTYDYGTSVTYSCDLSFNHTDGDLVRTCDETANWNGTLPVCTVAACIPDVITLGSYNPPDVITEFGDIITYTCDLGYYISAGDENRTCLTDGSWANTAPTCSLVECDLPPTVMFSSYSQSPATKFDYNTDVTYSCDLSYNHTDGNLTRTCKEDFSWSGDAPTCTIAACIQVDSTYMTTDPDKVLHEFGDVIVYSCILGYNYSSGDTSRTCQNDGTWTGVKPECVIVTCPTAIPAHASILPDVAEVNYNTYITYSCDLGYNRTDGDETRRCTELSTFDGTEANCTLVTCDPPAAIAYSTYDPVLVSHDYNTIVNFTCNLGYYLFSGNNIQRCDENADWVNTKPVCKIIECAKPTEAFTTVSPNQASYIFNTSMTSSCVTGYNLTDGDATRTCEHTAQWGGTPPNCTIVECDAPPPVNESSLSPNKNIYVYLDKLTYTCVIGYEITSGNGERTCTETGDWSGTAPDCTIIHCPLPPDGVRTSYEPALLDYVWNDTVIYSCDLGYNHSSGDLESTCEHTKTWSGTSPVCVVVTCDKIDVNHMTFSPPTADTHDFNTTIEYACVVGYNHSYGDLLRTCNYTGVWTGTLPNCTIITCDPPDPIPHTSYVPDNLTEHDWNTFITYSCDAAYHYVSGGNITTCNESGSFPPSDVDCSVKHELAISASEPAVTWFNSSFTQIDTVFDFDGLCDVSITCDPNLIDVTHVISGNEIIMTVKQKASTALDNYVCTLAPFHGERSFPDVHRNVFFGDAIVEFQAWLDHTDIYLEVGESYHFEANASSGSIMSMLWTLDDNITKTYDYSQDFSYMDFMHSFSSPWTNVTVEVSNTVSSVTINIYLEVIYALNNIDFIVNDNTRTTTENAHFELSINMTSAQRPMSLTNISITFLDGSAPVNFISDIQEVTPTTPLYEKDITYGTQGYYNVTVELANPLNSMVLNQYMIIWDKLDTVDLTCVSNCPIMITSTESTLEFTGVPRSGFEYRIDMADVNGTVFQSANSSILYDLYSLSVFNHIYTTPGKYNVVWNVSNGAYSKDGSKWIIVENEVNDFQAYLDHTMIYLAVGDTYNFLANATLGTSVSLDWMMEDTITVSQNYSGELSVGNLAYAFTKPKVNISVTARNLVSSQSVEVMVDVFYKVNNFDFTVASTLGNTTEIVDFDLHLLSTALLPMKEVNISIDFKHENGTTDSIYIDENYVLDKSHMYTHLFDMHGNFLVEATLTSILGSQVYNITMRIWDSLLALDLEFINGFGKYIITNTVAQFNFTNVPNFGFEYTIDYGDGTTGESSTDDSIMYAKYNLPVFTHVFTSPGVYKVSWTANNGAFEYDRAEHLVVHVQNKLPDTGFTLDPIGKKYPWTVLQNVSLPMNITLDVGVPEPTNATCIYEPDDGDASESGLVFDSSVFLHYHNYVIEGYFNASLYCSNDVSNYTYMFSLQVKKVLASDIYLVFYDNVPLNYSDSVIVYFHVENGGFEMLPYFVTLDWDFGDGHTSRRRRSPISYDRDTFTHEYFERDNYTVTIIVNAQASSTTNTISYSLRCGLMYFEYNTTVQFINTTDVHYIMYGVKGSAVYTIDFDDTSPTDQCTSSGMVSCDIHHLCPQYGIHLVQATVRNGSFIEIDYLNMTCDNPINVTMDIPYTVAIPDGTIDARLRIKKDDLYLPRLYCKWNMGDPIKRETYELDYQTVTFEDPYLFNFQYYALGLHTITIHCWNLINETHLQTQITVTNKDFLFTGVFDRFYSQEETPIYISSMHDTEIFSRLEIIASSTEKYHTNLWIIDNVTMGATIPDRHGFIFPRGLLSETKYYIKLLVCFKEEANNCIFEPSYVELVMPPPHAEIVGSKRRNIKRGSITIDAESLSYDPVFPTWTNLSFSWTCESFDATSFDDVEADIASGTSGTSCLGGGPKTTGSVTLNTNSNPKHSHYVVTVTVDNNRGLTSSFTQILAIENDEPLFIECKINCLSKVARSSEIQLYPQLSNNCPASYSWRLKKYSGSTYVNEDMSNMVSSAGTKSRSLTIKKNKLEFGTWYLVTLTVVQDGLTYGPAYYEFLTNRPPEGGSCAIIPVNETTLIPMKDKQLENTTVSSGEYNVVAGIDLFNLTCLGWQDEGFTDDTFTDKQPLFYLFFLSYGDDDNYDEVDNDYRRQLLYFDPGQTSNLVSFQVGNANNAFKATVVLRITDVFGDYTDVSFNVKSKPYLTTAMLADLSNEAMYTVTSDYIDQFDETLIKANRTYDYRTLSRKIMDISSIYNELNLNSSSGIILSPDDLLSLGYVRTDDETLLSWKDYWKIIVEVVDTQTTDYLISVGEEHAYMLHASVMTWPSDKRITLVAIEAISRALNESTAITEYSNVTAAILNAKCADILARNLAEIVDDRTFPNTEQVFAASKGLIDLVKNQLGILQTVLTPNLPQDPSVDEMRQYLEYISVFKTTEEVINAPLSLQEQTFLAQKQLQKYHLLKYIKSEASKRALPYLTDALHNLTYVLRSLSVLGEEEMFLENDFVYISVEVKPAYALAGKTISRPRVELELNELVEDNPQACNSSEINVRTVIFKKNPYFWGQFADRITSYVPLFEIDGATLGSDTITYRLQNEIEASCVDQDPTYEEDDPDKFIYILFDRQHAEDHTLIFLRPNTSQLVYELYFNKDEKPKVSENKYTYSTKMQKNEDDDTWTLEDGYKLLIKSSEYSETGKIWIALRPLLENSGDSSLIQRKFCANVTSVQCLAWVPESGSNNYVWDKDICEVSLSSTRSETYCTCQNTGHKMAVGTTFYVPYNKVDFKTLGVIYNDLGRSPVIGMMVATVCVYLIFAIWAWREDMKDQYKWSYSLMIDNDIADSYFYIVRVFTGLRTGAGTESKIGFVLVGEDGDTNIRILDDDSHIGFERGSIRTFVMSTRKYLGELICLRIWHDDSGGNNSSWYLNKINVTDLAAGRRFTFVSNSWFDFDSGDNRVDRVLNAQNYEDVRSYQDMIAYTIAEQHLWLSVVVRPIKGNFTRVQRLSCLLGLIYLTMIICTMIVTIPDEDTFIYQAVIGPFRFSMENFKAALISTTVSTVIIIIVSIFFRNAENENKGPNVDSFVNKTYRKVNDKLKLDQSVLSKRYWPPAEEALEHNYFFLPHFCVYVGWTILLMTLIIATFLLVSFSSDWELIKSEEWMTAVFVSFLTSVLLIEGIKILIIILVYSLMCQRAYEPIEPYIDTDRLEEIAKYNSATLTIGPQYGSVLYQPENPTKETLIKNKVKRIRNHQLLKIFSQLVVYSGLLYLVYTISYESRDPRSFYLKNHVEQMFHFTSEVTDLESYTNWLKGTFIETYFSKSFFGADYDGTENRIYMDDLTNLRVGPARLRQLRIRQEECIGPLGVNLTCRNKYVDDKKETQNFCLGWKKQPCPVAEKSTYFSSTAWEFTSASEVWGFPTVAQYCTYGGGGYFMKLDVNRDVCVIIFDELVQFQWFDSQTRGVILEFTLYNANTNLFVYSKFVGEFPEVGGFLPYIDIQVFRLYLNTGPDGDFVLFLQFFFLLFVIAATFSLAYIMFTDVKAFFKSVWNMLDLVALAMSYTTISIFIYKIFIIQKTIEQFESDKNAYVGFENLAFYDFITNTSYGVLVFLLSVRVSRILGYSGKINEMAAVITHAAGDLYGFLLIFGISYFAYVICGTLLFGKEQEKYKDVFQTYGTLTEAIIGKNRVSNILTAKPGFAEFYYFTFVLFVLMTLATMAAAILNFSISAVRKEHQKLAPTNIIEVIFDRLGMLVDKLKPSRRNSDKTTRERRDSDAELNDILTDLRVFIRGIRSKRAKTKSSDKYLLSDDQDDELEDQKIFKA